MTQDETTKENSLFKDVKAQTEKKKKSGYQTIKTRAV